MDENGISQLPVYGEGHLEGIVSGKKLIKPVFDGEFKLSDSISLAFKSDFRVIDASGEPRQCCRLTTSRRNSPCY